MLRKANDLYRTLIFFWCFILSEILFLFLKERDISNREKELNVTFLQDRNEFNQIILKVYEKLNEKAFLSTQK